MEIAEFQRLIEKTYLERDRNRGLEKNFMWFIEEVGELSEAIQRREMSGGKNCGKKHLELEFADVFAWMATLASLTGIELEQAIDKYRKGCPACGKMPCDCPVK
jgi:NTP pyrophosphatase (non-canonical NTP hydrolase)